jgi:hypothetical protein
VIYLRRVPTLGEAEIYGAIFVEVGDSELRPITTRSRVLHIDLRLAKQMQQVRHLLSRAEVNDQG